MQDLLTRIATATGLAPEQALLAVGYVLLYIKTEGTDPSVDTMVERVPGAAEAIVHAGTSSSGEPGLFAGGGIMALGSKLMGLGLDMAGISVVAGELVAYARKEAGAELVDRVLATTPGLAQFA
jgi:hypothetical protein